MRAKLPSIILFVGMAFFLSGEQEQTMVHFIEWWIRERSVHTCMRVNVQQGRWLQVKVTPHRPAPRRYPKKRLHSPLPAEMVVPLSLLAISTNEGSSGTNSSELQGQGSHWVMEALNSLPEEVEDPSSLEAYL
uniref:Uncharacterized protein n=1 Tax=Timema poppense TaxID=170557 RepID=A0A7R9CYP6_TIMPO|nr:unnamed protein product [Timema poppensis]